MRSYISEPDRGRRKWKDDIDAQLAVYSNRRRTRGRRGQQLPSMRGERIERSFAHLYETGGMRRTHLRGHDNIRKRVLIHGSAFNLGLLLRTMFGRGTPRGLQRLLSLFSVLTTVVRDVLEATTALWISSAGSAARRPELLTHDLVTA